MAPTNNNQPQEGLTGGTEMARWIPQTLHVSETAKIILGRDGVWIGTPGEEDRLDGPATFDPQDREDANAMAIALRLAAKRLEEIGKGLA